MTMHRYREDFEQPDTERSFEEKLARQHLAVARDVNQIARSASYAASAAAAAARFWAFIAMAAMIIAVSALVISVVTPEKIKSYLAHAVEAAKATSSQLLPRSKPQ